ncbi:hypothetical protein KUL118_65470 [Tenacibaculum sp. KUL118]|nr:hypothetical protein KUL113_55900 [Tenacibaculum sp. KUL113]GFD83685.1 hypothetical protein KUL118_65470 [Tenacibaculum sp. KUL118]
MYYNFHPITEEEKQLWFRAEMNKRQFQALGHRLANSDIENEIINNPYYLRINLSARYSNLEVAQWLKNSWNTERILFQNLEIIANTNQAFCMQWAFPQAYYTVFGNILAMFKAIGYTETSHTAVLKKYASIMQENKLPESISICCNGIDKHFEYHNIELPANVDGHMDLDLNNSDTIDHHICQFLRATRRNRLKEKAPKMNFKTKDGKKRKNLSQDNWKQVSNSIGSTSIIDFLYRKRIKGNYQDIETYNCPYFDGQSVLSDLIIIVDRLNLTNETYLSKAIGFDNYKNIAENHIKKVENNQLKQRIKTIEQLVKAIR